jgi:starch synthase
MRILIATPEAVPFAKTGGLADVAGSLIKEFIGLKSDAIIMLPLYKGIKEKFRLRDTGKKVSVSIGSGIHNGKVFSYGGNAFFIKCDEFFGRAELYGSPEGDYGDNAHRFVFFSKAVIEASRALGFRPDIIHSNDWQTALIPLYIKTVYGKDDFFKKTSTVLTIHNLGYQGIFPPSAMLVAGLDWTLFNPEGVEFYGNMNFLKAGIISADIITTVSATYAKEILDSSYGFGLDGVLRKRASDITGILNGIDYGEWDPGSDKLLPANYGPDDMSGKGICKGQLAKRCAFGKKDAPIAGMVGRLSSQKGLDIFLGAIDEILSCGVNVVVLGKGDIVYQDRLMEASKKHKGRLSVNIALDEGLAHMIYAGSDIFLMPSRYEPCGLGQQIAQRYGTAPVARKTGGLADTITDYDPLEKSGTGFLFSDYSGHALAECIKRALCAYSDGLRWQGIINSAMEADFSWHESAKKYLELYKRLGRKPAA